MDFGFGMEGKVKNESMVEGTQNKNSSWNFNLFSLVIDYNFSLDFPKEFCIFLYVQ